MNRAQTAPAKMLVGVCIGEHSLLRTVFTFHVLVAAAVLHISHCMHGMAVACVIHYKHMWLFQMLRVQYLLVKLFSQ